MSDTCGAPVQGVDVEVGAGEVVLTGKVSTTDGPVGGAFVRLLDSTGEFTAEVVSSPEGDFRFYAAPGTWTIRALHRSGNGQASVSADGPGVHAVSVAVA
ncbi:DUF1416 domain-containing protein [Actinosynnema sp. NPDC047251]|uniref:DUF1416 domain-containing protein n=1 Tax=Saccharothrix espanaensis (strain ATCC 51144 / DSM 44229 / JCM 9112 / NBRC 15066 / NRRL 15764) TaxID=1179773 RepID=K0K565_SACES|nr:DUF1416 domain-containing protein [Saccharothrix espanaensis]CCH35420.1 hypothetical protein BN6_82030 [Saccharothrix espanaensis DSM 44229]